MRKQQKFWWGAAISSPRAQRMGQPFNDVWKLCQTRLVRRRDCCAYGDGAINTTDAYTVHMFQRARVYQAQHRERREKPDAPPPAPASPWSSSSLPSCTPLPPTRRPSTGCGRRTTWRRLGGSWAATSALRRRSMTSCSRVAVNPKQHMRGWAYMKWHRGTKKWHWWTKKWHW